MSHSIEQTRKQNPMWVYEHNYRLFVGLFAGLCDGTEAELVLNDANQHLNVTLLEQARYTQTFRCQHRLDDSNTWLDDMRLTVRLYHDAGLAEVLHYQESAKLQPEYGSCNPEMMHKDEKLQANRLLWDWLNRLSTRRKRQDGVVELNV